MANTHGIDYTYIAIDAGLGYLAGGVETTSNYGTTYVQHNYIPIGRCEYCGARDTDATDKVCSQCGAPL